MFQTNGSTHHNGVSNEHATIDLLMLHGITETGDGLPYNHPAIDNDEMEEMLDEL